MESLIKKLSDPRFFQEHRLDPHSDHVVYAPEDDGTASSLRMSLNGTWKFHYAENFQGMPEDFEALSADVSDWDDIRVPGHIQLQGYGNPQYVNVQYPWDGREEIDPGQIPTEFNLVASYVTWFSLPEHFRDKRVFISFQGVESCFRLWLNGAYVGFSSDSFTPSEFELTSYLRPGENRLAVQVFQWYSGSWLEDQDFFRFSGIFRDVYLYAVPQQHVWDVKVETDWEYAGNADRRNGTIRLTLEGDLNDACLKLELKDPNRLLLEERELRSKDVISTEFSVPDPLLWSAEKPDLYTLKVTVCEASGKPVEWFEQRIGIRRFEMDGNIMKLNGKRIVFKGVNRHEFSIDTGRTVSREDLVTDLLTMKQHNINAIRLCHYPNSSEIYHLADEMGFYLIDECNMETHGSWDAVERGVRPADYAVPGDHLEYQEMLLDRVRSMVQRDKNHPSILIWSCGNESFGGPVIHRMSQELHKLDPSRLVHYEGVFHDRRFPYTSDMESQMYPSVRQIREFLSEHRDKPFICCEYMHAMGNSCGALHKYTDLAGEDPLYQGGFIWDYIDQAIRTRDRYGREYLGYGGDFGDRPNDGNFSGDGIVYGDRTPTPKMVEVKYCYQNIRIKILEDSFTVDNQHLFTDTEDYVCRVLLERNGYFVQEEEMQVSVPPQDSRNVPLPFPVPEESGEYAVTVSFRLKRDTAWAKVGHEVAFGQEIFRKVPFNPEGYGDIAWRQIVPEKTSEMFCGKHGLQVIHGSYNIGVKGAGFEVLFSRLSGALISYRYQGEELLKGAVRPNFWRAPTDNDRGNKMPFRCGLWKTASLYADSSRPDDMLSAFQLKNPVLKEEDDQAIVTYTYYYPVVPCESIHSVQLQYTVRSDGSIVVAMEYEPPQDLLLPEFPEFSVMLKMDADYDRMEWYGRGPQDNYPDRKEGTRVGIYQAKVMDTVAHYLVPQESGSHTDARWMKVTNRLGHGLLVTCPAELLDVSVSPWSPHELEEALHSTELPPVHNTWLRIGQQMGVGGDDSWGAPVHEEYQLPSDCPRSITFVLKGI